MFGYAVRLSAQMACPYQEKMDVAAMPVGV